MAKRIIRNVKTGEVTEEEFTFVPAPITNETKLAEVHRIVAEKSSQLSNPLDNLRMTVITGLQGDRARGRPMPADRQAILDSAEADPRKPQAEALLIAVDDIIANIDTIDDVAQAFIDRGIV